MIPLLFGALIAAGVVVDGVVAIDGGVTQQATLAPDEPALVTGSIVLRPGLSGGFQSGGQREPLLVIGGYAPQLSFVTSGNGAPIVLHVANMNAQIPIGTRIVLRATTRGAAGALDPATAQTALRLSSFAEPQNALPYANATASTSVATLLTRTLLIDTGMFVEGTVSPSDPTIPLSTTGSVDGKASWQFGRADAASFGIEGKRTEVERKGYFVGVVPVIGWQHQLGRSAGFEVRGGLGAYSIISFERDFEQVVYLPSGDARAHMSFDLAGASALQLDGAAAVGAVNDILGALIEQRFTTRAGVSYRANRQLSFRVEGGGFVPLGPSLDPSPKVAPLNTASLLTRASIAWAFHENAALEVSALAMTRFEDVGRIRGDTLLTDRTATLSLTGNMALFHDGERPKGSDVRTGRDITTSELGVRPPPSVPTIQEPERLTDDETVRGGEEYPSPEPRLRRPPPNVPIVAVTIDLGTPKKTVKIVKEEPAADDAAPTEAPADSAPPQEDKP